MLSAVTTDTKKPTTKSAYYLLAKNGTSGRTRTATPEETRF
jgi:hypothetical protein